jgi:hypothetical protein
MIHYTTLPRSGRKRLPRMFTCGISPGDGPQARRRMR